MRLFIALPVPAEYCELIVRTAQGFSDIRALRRTRGEQMHITLNFLGEREEAEMPHIISGMEAACLKVSSFRLAFQGLGAFPSPMRPRVVTVPVIQGLEQLRCLHYLLGNAISGGDSGRFSPHITLGRVRFFDSELIRRLALPGYRTQPEGSWMVHSVCLFSSILHPSGAEYSIIAKRNLKNTAI